MNKLFSTIVLAGGLSRRMGTDKALLNLKHQYLLERTVEVAWQSGSQTVTIVTPWPDRYQILPGVQKCEWILEECSSSPLEAFYLGIGKIANPWVLLLACDLPQISSRSIGKWSQALELLPPQVMAYLPKRERWEPLCGFYRTDCQHALGQFLIDSDRSFQRWLNMLTVQAIPQVEPTELFNCNTPQQWQQVLLIHGSNTLPIQISS
ncbi:MAG: molybdenum cofactor guanylyltransferase [Sphingomonadaceae bacterium]